jgi:hypothetical protein
MNDLALAELIDVVESKAVATKLQPADRFTEGPQAWLDRLGNLMWKRRIPPRHLTTLLSRVVGSDLQRTGGDKLSHFFRTAAPQGNIYNQTPDFDFQYTLNHRCPKSI